MAIVSDIRDLFRTVGPKTVIAAAKAKVLKRPTPLQIVFEVTHLCNLVCEYCDRHTPLPNELKLPEVVEVIRDFVELGMVGMTLDGGDPLVRRDIGDIIDELARLDVRIVINTNGVLIPAKLGSVEKAALVNVSLDGPEAYHDSMRGSGSFEKAVRGIRAARNAGVTVQLRCTVHKANIRSVPELLQLAETLDSPIMFQPALNSLFLATDRDGSLGALDPSESRKNVLWPVDQQKQPKYRTNQSACPKARR